MPKTITTSSLGGVPIQLDTLARDYESIRRELINLASQLTPEWTDFAEIDPGVAILEAMAYVGGIQSYGTDRVQNEAYLVTAQLRESVVQLCRTIGYELSPGSAASAPLAVKTNVDSVSLPVGWTLTSQGSASSSAVSFELLKTVDLGLAGWWTTTSNLAALNLLIAPEIASINDDLIAVHGTSIYLESVGVSTGEANQEFVLGSNPLILSPDGLSPLKLFVDQIQWDNVDSFLESEPADNHYLYQILANGVVKIIFSDGLNGVLPPSGAVVQASYRIGGGTIGNNVGIRTLGSPEPPVAGVVGVFNIAQPSNGSDPETNDEAKINAPLSFRANNRAVTLEDFEILAIKTPSGGVSAARAAHLNGPFVVDIFIAAQGDNPVPTGEWYPDLDTGTGLIGSVGRWLVTKKIAPTKINVSGPTVVRPYLEAKIITLPNILIEDAKKNVENNIREFLVQLSKEFAGVVPLSRLYQIIENSRGVDWVKVVAFHRKATTRLVKGKETAYSSAVVTVNNFSLTTIEDLYFIHWINGNTFKLVGDSYGELLDSEGKQQVFLAGVEHSVSHYIINPTDTQAPRTPQFNLKINLTSFTNAGDIWSFGTDSYLGDIKAQEFEMIVPTLNSDGSISSDEMVLTYGGGLV